MVVKSLVADLSFPVAVVAHPTVRESDGLALSSRNVFLSPDDRSGALLLSKGLLEAAASRRIGAAKGRGPQRSGAHDADPLEVEYIELASQDRADVLEELDRPAFLAAAVRVGSVRLIDNIAFDIDRGRGGGRPRGPARATERPLDRAADAAPL